MTLRDAEVAKSRGTCTPTPDEADMDDGKAEVYLSCYFSSALRLPGLGFFLPQSHHGSSALARQSLSLFAHPNKTAMLRRLWSSSLKNWTPLSTSKSLSNEYVSRKLLVPYSGQRCIEQQEPALFHPINRTSDYDTLTTTVSLQENLPSTETPFCCTLLKRCSKETLQKSQK